MSRHRADVSAYFVHGGTSYAPPPVTLKPRVSGLVTVTDFLQGDTAVANSKLNNGINHTMIRFPWSTIQPVDGSHFSWSELDAALASANAGTFFKIGIDCGGWAPAWLKAITGNIDVFNTADGKTTNCPYWWTVAYHDAYSALQQAMAARYDGDSRVKMVVDTGSMNTYFEPWILGGDAPTGVALFALGVDQTVQQHSVETSLRETLAAWTTTPVEHAIHNQFQVPKSTGINFINWTAGARDWLNPIASEFGPKLFITDYGLGPTDTLTAHNPGSSTLLNCTDQYAWMKLRRDVGQGPVAYQLTLGSFSVANLKAAIQNGIDLHASYIETSGFNSMTTTDRAAYDAALKLQA